MGLQRELIKLDDDDDDDDEYLTIVPGLPEDLGLECLVRVPHTSLSSMTGVCKRWRDLVTTSHFQKRRKCGGFTTNLVCFVQQRPCTPAAAAAAAAAAVPTEYSSSSSSLQKKESNPRPVYGLTLFDPIKQLWEDLPCLHDDAGLPLFCRCVFSALEGGKLLLIGGWDPSTWAASRSVHVYDFVTRKWKRGKEMPGPARSFFGAAAIGDKVIVAGGHDEGKTALRTAIVYDVTNNDWEELTETMSEERDECEAVAVDGELWVVGGYPTEEQGRFVGSAEVYNLEEGKWRKVEGVWEEGKCGKGCIIVANTTSKNDNVIVGVGDGRVKAGRCVVGSTGTSGTWAVVTGSEYEGGPPVCYLVNGDPAAGGKDGKEEWAKLEIPTEFSGFIQSGCYVQV